MEFQYSRESRREIFKKGLGRRQSGEESMTDPERHDHNKRNKRSYLRDFEKHADGSYVYTGQIWHADPILRRRLLGKLWLLQGIMLVAGLLNTYYVILPYAFWFLSDVILTYTLGSMTFGGNPLRNYIYERSVAQYALRTVLPLAGAGLTAAGELIFLLRGGVGEGGGICLLCCAVQIAASLIAGKSRPADIWTI